MEEINIKIILVVTHRPDMSVCLRRAQRYGLMGVKQRDRPIVHFITIFPLISFEGNAEVRIPLRGPVQGDSQPLPVNPLIEAQMEANRWK